MEWIKQPWPWYVAGPLIGLMVPALLIMGNKTFGVSSSLRHICAACFPANIPFFRYDWKKELWNLFFVAGITAGAAIAVTWLNNPLPLSVHPALVHDLKQYGINNYYGTVPPDLFDWNALLTARGIILIIAGGFLVGFGTRYAGGCTSGHSIMGLSNLQWPSLVATCCFMIGGFATANLLLPLILQLK
ncbi:MAG TPA: YeeE/YedE family protein [Agriterribacter sp.]|nr:YeeE/YedE family protein [Agriterribacter sp.]